MPAQWPTFVKNVSKKLESRNVKTRDKFAIFLANEYFKAVKSSQTIFGNKHVSGQKAILEKGFIAAFKEIYENETIKFENKFEMSRYADFFEPLPNNNFDFDPLCEIEEWTKNNEENLKKFKFYQMFPSTCPPYKEIDIYAGIDFDLIISQNQQDAASQIENSSDGILYATMSIANFTPDTTYKFLYSINGIDQPLSLASDDGILQVRVDTTPGTYDYIFKSVFDSNDNLIKDINKKATVTIGDEGQVDTINIIKDPNEGKTPRQLIPELTKEQTIEVLADRVLHQCDGSEEFKIWVERLAISRNNKLGAKVAKRVEDLIESYYKSEEEKLRSEMFSKSRTRHMTLSNLRALEKRFERKVETTIRNKIPKTSQLIELGILSENTLNEYIFQSQHSDDPITIPKWLTTDDYICKFTYIKDIDFITQARLVNEGDSWDELNRIRKKESLYKKERELWWELLRKWGNSKNVNERGETIINSDGYNIMAKAIIDYWKSTAVQPFKKTPPIPPCNTPPPLGGIYTPISYGSESILANDLRRAWNTGKRFSKQPLTPVASKAVASAVSVACAKHLLKLKFLYLGGITTPVGPIPMVGFSPLVI